VLKTARLSNLGAMKTFENWYSELVRLAKAEDLLWMVSNDPEDHREGYEDGNTPAEELDEQKYAASS